MSDRSVKRLSVVLTVGLLGVLAVLWAMMNHHEVDTFQLTDSAAVAGYLRDNWDPEVAAEHIPPTTLIPTGVYVQSLRFADASEVYLTGFIWQHYRDGVNDTQKPPPGEPGFVLPEQVNSGNDIAPREIYRIRQGDEEVIGWYFEAMVRQPFDYATYPFDHKTVWLRLWPRDFANNVVLVPDLASYQATGKRDIFGIDESIVLGTWKRMDTYFDYQATGSDTNFGIQGYIGMQAYPELRYNFLIRRNFQDAFVVHLLPLLMVLTLLYAALLTITDDPDLSERFGFNASTVIGSCSALFFVVLLAHMQLRQEFAGWSVVYIEYFYFLLYVILVLGAAYAYMFAARRAQAWDVLYARDNLVLKAGYWPFVLVCMIAITAGVMLANPT
jgi:hypothetical protein